MENLQKCLPSFLYRLLYPQAFAAAIGPQYDMDGVADAQLSYMVEEAV